MEDYSIENNTIYLFLKSIYMQKFRLHLPKIVNGFYNFNVLPESALNSTCSKTFCDILINRNILIA